MKPWEFLEEYYEKKKKEAQLPQQERCISCDEQKGTHKICMDCIGKMIKENQQEISDVSKGSDDTFKVWECCGMEECICKHPSVISENGNELLFDKEGNLIKELPKQETFVSKGSDTTSDFEKPFMDFAKQYVEQLKPKKD
jgi:ribosomal protein L32